MCLYCGSIMVKGNLWTMQISVIIAHPDPQSFNHAIAQTAIAELVRNGYQVIFHDLYAEGFDPILPKDEIPRYGRIPKEVALHCHEIANAEGIIIIHPNWWGQPPAILKGWVDRVFRPGVAYEFVDGDKGEGVPVGLLRAGTALVFNTSNTPTEREERIFGDPLETLWKNCIFGLCGVGNFHRRMFSVVVTSSKEQRQGWLRQVQEVTGHYFPGQRQS
jgi:NAD(P)H dehydrogenase (quinone)